jgi:hypothetical protein
LLSNVGRNGSEIMLPLLNLPVNLPDNKGFASINDSTFQAAMELCK